MKRKFKQTDQNADQAKVTAEFTKAELKKIYNALLIDQLSNDNPDLLTEKILKRLDEILK